MALLIMDGKTALCNKRKRAFCNSLHSARDLAKFPRPAWCLRPIASKRPSHHQASRLFAAVQAESFKAINDKNSRRKSLLRKNAPRMMELVMRLSMSLTPRQAMQ